MENYLNILNNSFSNLKQEEIVFYASKSFIASTHKAVGHPQPPHYLQPSVVALTYWEWGHFIIIDPTEPSTARQLWNIRAESITPGTVLVTCGDGDSQARFGKTGMILTQIFKDFKSTYSQLDWLALFWELNATVTVSFILSPLSINSCPYWLNICYWLIYLPFLIAHSEQTARSYFSGQEKQHKTANTQTNKKPQTQNNLLLQL